ncbi:MAG TPA: branched-chain amino acid ABC transporter permease, partial [Acidimicrobiales bacterium]|nr:branched-chain amino acid ABC transporter permease [Acidimicrobiales bacterium]
AFFAIGAYVGAKATIDWGLDMSLAFVISFVVGGAVAALVGLPALRRRGFYLAVATLAFSLATTSYLLNPKYFGWVPDGRVPRRPLFGKIDLTSTASMYYVVFAVLVICLFLVKGIHDSRTGRAFMALRDNERAAEAYGLHATRVRLVAFAFSGALAGLAGCLYAHQQQGIDPDAIAPFQNLLILTYVIIGGVTAPIGAIIGAAYWIGLGNLLPVRWQILASGVGVLLVLLILPSGLGGLYYRLRDRWLARVAKAHDVVAPGLATTEPDAPIPAPPMLPEPEDTPIPRVAVD